MTAPRGRRGLGRAVVAGASACALLAAVSGSAQAASGSYTYYTASGQAMRVDEPPSNLCLPLQGGAVRFDNDTTDTAFLYGDSACGGGYDIVGVGARWDWLGVPAQGVRLGSTG